jgi:hypothetical protein
MASYSVTYIQKASDGKPQRPKTVRILANSVSEAINKVQAIKPYARITACVLSN